MLFVVVLAVVGEWVGIEPTGGFVRASVVADGGEQSYGVPEGVEVQGVVQERHRLFSGNFAGQYAVVLEVLLEERAQFPEGSGLDAGLDGGLEDGLSLFGCARRGHEVWLLVDVMVLEGPCVVEDDVRSSRDGQAAGSQWMVNTSVSSSASRVVHWW